ncbi:MAG: OsmC family protein [Anaerolineales bacterium]|nr:OsmC family protein [Anaerolineales bacterium]
MIQETNLPKIMTAINKPGTIQTQIKIRNHEIKCDEEPLYEGNDEAPDPYDYVIAGVGGCTAISLRLFAQKKGWDIGDIDMILTYDFIDGEDIVKKEICFTGDLTDEQREVLLHVAHCGTEKMLERGMKFINTIVTLK